MTRLQRSGSLLPARPDRRGPSHEASIEGDIDSAEARFAYRVSGSDAYDTDSQNSIKSPLRGLLRRRKTGGAKGAWARRAQFVVWRNFLALRVFRPRCELRRRNSEPGEEGRLTYFGAQ
jgi:hypothetical protein